MSAEPRKPDDSGTADEVASSETLLASPISPPPQVRAVTSPDEVAGSETLLAPSRPAPIVQGSQIATVSGRGGQSARPLSRATATSRPPLSAGAAGEDPLVGKRIDHFEVRGRLGEGGMGAVYLAHDLSLDRPVAIKVLRQELAADGSLIDRLIAEARAQARLQHPHVVTIHYIGSYRQAPYFAMEYVHGQSLEERLEREGALPWAQALECVIQTAQALAAASRAGIVHRDVKPSNLILATDRGAPQVLVADFGLAAPAGGREGAFAGSPHYASPEQIAGLPLDHRSDIYALGITFYQLVTGSRPFDATTLTDLFAQHKVAPRPPIPEERAPWRLRRLVGEMMDPDAAKRPASYESLIARLEALRPKETAAGGVVARGMALGVDLAVLGVFGQILAGLAPLSQVVAHQLGMILFGAYYVISQLRWKRTIGKHFFHLRTQSTRGPLKARALVARFLVEFWGPIVAVLMINLQLGAATDLEAVKQQIAGNLGVRPIPIIDDSLQAVLRTVLVPNLLLAVPWLGGFAFALFDGKRQALHDRAANTRVVYQLRI